MIKSKKVSELPEVDQISNEDLLAVTIKENDSYASRKITVVNFFNAKIEVIPSNTYDYVSKQYSDRKYYLTTSDDYVRVQTTSNGKYEVVLPLATGSGKTYIIKNVSKRGSEATVYLIVTESDLIDIDYVSYPIRSMEFIQIIDGATGNWEIIAKG
jgi:hypothetical protein